MLLAYRDNARIDLSGTTFSFFFSTKNYDCVKNETSIHDCHMVQHESSDFCLIDAFKKWKTGKLFHHCDTPIYEVFCHFFFDTSIK